jgi:hypothetical protein
MRTRIGETAAIDIESQLVRHLKYEAEGDKAPLADVIKRGGYMG